MLELRELYRKIATSLVVLPFMVHASLAQEGAVCFQANRKPDAFVIQQAPPPAPRDQSFPYYPASGFASANINAIEATETEQPVYYWQWANHGIRIRHKANIIPRVSGPLELTANFSSPALADACTIAQTQSVLGLPTDLPHSLRGVSLEAMPDTEQTDVCALPPALTAEFTGIVLDFEVFDDRTPEEARDFLLNYAALVKAQGKSVILYTNPLDAPSQRRTGIRTETLPAISAAYDFVTIVLWHRNRQKDLQASFRAQAEMLGDATAKKGLITFELANTTLDDARFVRRLLNEGAVRGVNFWRNYGRQGGTCNSEINRKISCISFGEC